MDENQPLVSIIIPCYNVAETILETLKSACDQTYKKIEIIIVDDGSTDNLELVLQSTISDNGNIKFFRQEVNRGLPATRNVGFLQSSGQYLVFLDGDDLLDPSFVEECCDAFINHTDVSLVYTNVMLFEAENRLFKLPKYSYSRLLLQNCIVATAMIKRENFEHVGLYDESLKVLEDWELWIRYLDAYPNIYKIEKSLFFYRKRVSRNSMTDLDEVHNISDYTALYIYQKHYQIYSKHKLGIRNLLQSSIYRRKHYLTWYRQLFYLIFNKKKLRILLDQLG